MSSRKALQAERRASLVSTATEIFAERGYAAATMGDIARAAGVAKGTPYLYFDDKTDLFYAVFENVIGEMTACTNAALKTTDTALAQLRAIALGAVDHMALHRDWFPLSLEVWAASNTPALRQRFAATLHDLYAGYRTQAIDIIREGQAAAEIRAEVDATALATMLVGAVDGLFLQCWFDSTLDARQVIEDFFDALTTGIRAG